jgi:hypothetical protein
MFRPDDDRPFKEVVPCPNEDQLRTLTSMLDSADIVPYSFNVRGVSFDVYCAKPLHVLFWISEVLYRLVLAARTSYYCYGYYPPLDRYDQKAAIYVVRIRYPFICHRCQCKEPHNVEEIMSLRFIPGDGMPYGCPDFTEMEYGRGGDIGDLVRARLCSNDANYLRRVVTMSRLCGVLPYAATSHDQERSHMPERHYFTSLAFALMHHVFFRQYPDQFHVLTGVLRHELVNRVLSKYIKSEQRTVPDFCEASVLLGKAIGRKIRVNRRGVAYACPSFFLKIPELINCLERLLDNGMISEETLSFYTGASLQDLRGDRVLADGKLRDLGRLLTTQGPLRHAAITGAKLRQIVRREVPDGPVLYLMLVQDWVESIRRSFSSVIIPWQEQTVRLVV